MQDEPLEFGIARGYRLGAIYLLLASVLVTPLVYRVICDAAGLPHVRAQFYTIYAAAILFSLFLLWQVYDWRIRLDSHGVHRRSCCFWRHWPWWLFETGHARRGATYFAFHFPSAPFYRRKLDFAFADDSDAREALRACYYHWIPPMPAPLPVGVMFKAAPKKFDNWQLSSPSVKIRLAPAGLWIGKKTKLPTHSWRDVKRLVVFRPSRDHENFTFLRFEVGEWALQCEHSRVKGPPPDVAAFFEAYAPPDALVLCTEDPPETLLEVDERLDYLRQRMRQSSVWGAIGSGALGFVNYLFLLSLERLDAVDVIGLLALLLPLAQPIHTRIKLRKQEKDLLAAREGLDPEQPAQPSAYGS